MNQFGQLEQEKQQQLNKLMKFTHGSELIYKRLTNQQQTAELFMVAVLLKRIVTS